MIRYQDRAFSLIFRLEGSVYINTLYYSGTATILAILCIIWRDVFDAEFIGGGGVFEVFAESFTYSVFTFVLGFVLVFRCQLAYSRFWGGRAAMEAMTNSWTDALIKSVVFGKYANLPECEIRLWRTKMVSLFSLLHATALSSLNDYDSEMEVVEGIDKSVTDRLNSDGILDDVYTIYAWIQEELMMQVLNEGIAAPPPIATRMWDDLTKGIQGYNNAHMIHDTPFPFAYAQIISLNLMMFTASCGYMFANIMNSQFWVVFMTFVAVSGYVSLNEVAQELEDPFGDDPNDLPLQHYQRVINQRLKQFLYVGERDYMIPNASIEAQKSAEQYRGVTKKMRRTSFRGDDDDVIQSVFSKLVGESEKVSTPKGEPEKVIPLSDMSAFPPEMGSSPKIHPMSPEMQDTEKGDSPPRGSAYKPDDEDDEEGAELGFKWVQGLDDSFKESDLRNRGKMRRDSGSETIRLL